ncbi:MAG: asparagine synthase [Candidatus Competibacteraceae bacterium]|nr:asparagine synthase [Candidatus Competibacteraceae bacterium]MCP5124407.1 asparagine synthase [Gammaproteobacteria bacterium]
MTLNLLSRASSLAGYFNPARSMGVERIQAALTPPLRELAALSVAGACCAVIGGEVLEDQGLLLAIAGRARHIDAGNDMPEMLRRLATDYRTCGTAALQKLSGAFALAILDPERRTALLAIDRIGIEQLYYAPQADDLLFATTPTVLTHVGGFDAGIDPQAIYDYLYCHMIPSPRTIYRGLHKLPASYFLEWRDGAVQVAPYWLPEFTETPIDITATGREMLEIIETVIRREAGATSAEHLGAFLSGGIDSSTVAGMLARATQPAHTYSIGFNAPGYDEMDYARTAVRHFQTTPHEYYVTPDDVAEWLPQIANITDEPFGNSSLLPAFCCARFAKEQGITRLLGGDGGDELFAGNERYATQGIFELFGRLPSALQALLAIAVKPLATVPLARKAHSYVRQARIPLPDRMDSYAFLVRHEPIEVFNPDFLNQVSTLEPLELKQAAFFAPRDASDLNRMLYLDWHFTLHDNDLVKINTACRLAGVEIAYPLLDDEVVALSCRIPSAEKLRGMTLRWFYKEAVRGFLPDTIINKKKHGFGLPFGVWTRSDPRLLAITDDALDSLKQRDWFQPAFLDQARQMHREVHAAYYGELVWILTMLELWLRGNTHNAIQ